MPHTNPSDQDIVEWLPTTLPDRRIKYGTDPLHFGDLRLPPGPAPAAGHPVAIVLHGGGYSPNWNLDNMARLAESLTMVGGIATWNLEYRRPGQVGGGWPGTWLDIANGIDHLRTIAPRYRLDLGRTVAVGHSAGGTFATWAAARAGIPEGNDLYIADPLDLGGVVCLTGMLDLDLEVEDRANPPRHMYGLLTDQASQSEAAQSDVSQSDVSQSLGEFEAHLAEAAPVVVARHIRAPHRMIVGNDDAEVMIEQTRRFTEAVQRNGHSVDISAEYLDGANHFDVIDPRGDAWPVVARAVFELLGVEVPAERLSRPRYRSGT